MSASPEVLEFARNMADPVWRISNLYKIIIKGDGDNDDGLVVQFNPNRAQRRFIANLHHRNIILKARQLGFTTLIAIAWLDHALFNPNSRCGIIAQDREAAEVIFRDKVKFAYNNLPSVLKENMPLARDSATELLFGHNNSSIRVATSMRSGTIHRLHVSEFGKICAKFPDKAREVITGSIPAVPIDGITVIESTAEGQEGEFYNMTQASMALEEQQIPLSKKDYRMHFYAWYEAPEYAMGEDAANITEKDHEYFDAVEAEMGIELSIEQRSWYIATRDTDFSGSDEKMWQEYPSTPKEAFQVSKDGNYYDKQLTIARKNNRICNVPVLPTKVHTFWDIGNSDGCAIWFMQRVGFEDRFIDYLEAHGEDLSYYIKELNKKDYLYGEHYLPHDADYERLSKSNKSTKKMLQELGLKNIKIVPRTPDIAVGIQQTRDGFASAWFDQERCKLGLQRLTNYKKRWIEKDGRFSQDPVHDINSEGADSFRQYGQAKAIGMLNTQERQAPLLRPNRPIDAGMGY